MYVFTEAWLAQIMKNSVSFLTPYGHVTGIVVSIGGVYLKMSFTPYEKVTQSSAVLSKLL